MEFKGTIKNIGVANVPDRFSVNSTEGFYELYTSPFGMGIVGYAEKQEDALLFSKAYKILEMLQSIVNDFEGDYMVNGEIVDEPYEWLIDRYTEAKQLIKEATELNSI